MPVGQLREKPPLPPADLARRKPHLVNLPEGAVLHRFFTAQYDPVFFDRGPDGRLNAPDGSYGVLYAGRKITRRGAPAEIALLPQQLAQRVISARPTCWRARPMCGCG